MKDSIYIGSMLVIVIRGETLLLSARRRAAMSAEEGWVASGDACADGGASSARRGQAVGTHAGGQGAGPGLRNLSARTAGDVQVARLPGPAALTARPCHGPPGGQDAHGRLGAPLQGGGGSWPGHTEGDGWPVATASSRGPALRRAQRER